ncbi:MAG: glycoside hydrolase family 11 protein [Fibrobacter sp.]|nr:glycoside hydrolase family 11 protein [Fibrobacter sp.]
MQIKCIARLLTFVYVTATFVHHLSAQTITKNQIGVQGEYHYEYWMDYSIADKSDTMTLGDGGNFSCSWDSVNNILFMKGKRPGVRNQVITYSADYKPSGNSYMGAYGWTKNPLVEYYIVDSWGAWKPPGVTSKGTLVSDSGVYDIYEKYVNNFGIEPAKQFWSVRQNKRTSGTITCVNHFDAWAAKNMVMGEMYEVMFFVEGYQSSGTADVKMSMTSGSTAISDNLYINQLKTTRPGVFGTPSQTVISNSRQTLTFITPKNCYVSPKVYNLIGQEVISLPGKKYSAGKHSVIVNPNSTGKYFYTFKAGR